MIIGISGTRKGATRDQKETLEFLLGSPRVTRLIHGGAVGADTEADRIFRAIKDFPRNPIDIYPAQGHPWKGPKPSSCDIERPPLDRNRIIVRRSDIMLIVALQSKEILRRSSGTWATYRYSLQDGVITLVILPDGRTELAPL